MHEVGSIVEGKVTGITQFGAFVELDDGTVGMVHISEVSQTYVNDISEHLKENQEVKVKILAINDDKKISLSIKKALPPLPRNNNNNYNKGDRNFDRNNGNNSNRGDRNDRNDRGDRGDRNFNRNDKNQDRGNGDRTYNNNRNQNNGDRSYNNNRNNNNGDRNNNNGDRTYNNQKSGSYNNRSNNNNNNNKGNYQNNNFNRNATTPKGPASFEDMLSKFMSSSEDKMSDVKKPSSNRRGGHSSKRTRDYD